MAKRPKNYNSYNVAATTLLRPGSLIHNHSAVLDVSHGHRGTTSSKRQAWFSDNIRSPIITGVPG